MISNSLGGLVIAVAALGTVLGVPAASPAEVVWAALAAAGAAAWAVLLPWTHWRLFLHRPRPRRADLAVRAGGDGPGLVIGWPRAPLLLPLAGVSLLALGALLVGIAALWDGAPALAWISFTLAGLLGALLPDLWARSARRHRTVLDESGITVNGWDADVHLAWDDVMDAAPRTVGALNGILQIVPVPGARSYSWRSARRRLLIRARPTGGTVDIPLTVLDVEPEVLAWLVRRCARDPRARRELLDGRAENYLRGITEVPLSSR